MSTPLTVTRIGHACQLIDIGGTRVLTDPWFTQTATYYPGEPADEPTAGGDGRRGGGGLTAVLEPTLAVPHHYAFHSGWLGDRMITKSDQDPRHYADAVARIAPQIDVRLVLPGTAVTVP